MTGGSEIRVVGPCKGFNLPYEWNNYIDENTTNWTSCRKRSYWFAALDASNKIVAVGALDAEWGTSQYTGWLGPTFVSEAVRGQGIQSKLIAVRLKLAKEVGLKNVCSATDLKNSPSLRNLLNARFKVTGYCRTNHHLELEYEIK